jgi:glucosamine 6-phosphate synthetase-like amidotransferase/phosphosugar isomerase protein
MCGICGVIGKKRGNGKLFVKLLRETEKRGKDATGMYWKPCKTNEVKQYKEPYRVSEFMKVMSVPRYSDADYLIGHTRNATRGNPKDNNENHPHEYGDWIIIHNGIIDNPKELYKECGVKQAVKCDSAVIPVVFEKYGFQKGLEKLEGWFVIVAVRKSEPGRLYIGKSQSLIATLNFGFYRDIMFFVSDRDVALSIDKNASFMKRNTWLIIEDGDIVDNGTFEHKKSNKVEDLRTGGYGWGYGSGDTHYKSWKDYYYGDSSYKKKVHSMTEKEYLRQLTFDGLEDSMIVYGD